MFVIKIATLNINDINQYNKQVKFEKILKTAWNPDRFASPKNVINFFEGGGILKMHTRN